MDWLHELVISACPYMAEDMKEAVLRRYAEYRILIKKKTTITKFHKAKLHTILNFCYYSLIQQFMKDNNINHLSLPFQGLRDYEELCGEEISLHYKNNISSLKIGNFTVAISDDEHLLKADYEKIKYQFLNPEEL